MRIIIAAESPLTTTTSGKLARAYANEWLKEGGHEVYVMSWSHIGEDIKHEEGWTLCAGGSNFGGEFLNGTSAPTVADREMARLKPDVVYTDAPIWAIAPLVVACNAFNIPLVAHITQKGFPMSHRVVNTMGLLHTPIFTNDHTLAQFNSLVERYKSDGIGIIEEAKNPFMDRYGGHGYFCPLVIQNGVSEVFKDKCRTKDEADLRKQLGIPVDNMVFISVGRNNKRRDYPRLLEAFKLACESDDEISLIIHCGDPKGVNLDGWNLLSLSTQMGLNGRVFFTDQSANPREGLSDLDLNDLYNCSDVFITASRGSGNNLAAKEASRAGLPVVMMDEYCLNRIEVVTQCMEADETYYNVADIKSIQDWFLVKDGFHVIPDGVLSPQYCDSAKELLQVLKEATTKPHPLGNNTKVN